MSKGTTYCPGEFQPNGRGYRVNRIETVSDERDVAFLYRCVEHYKDRSPHMLRKHLRNLIIALEKKIRRDYCE